jgi:hypothetical protein
MAELSYEVSFKGAASPTLCAAFDDWELQTGSGVTLLRCDQRALHTVIDRIQDLGLELLDVRLVAEPASGRGPPPTA